MNAIPLAIGACLFFGLAAGQTTAFHTFTPPPAGSDIIWPASLVDGDMLEAYFEYDGMIDISNGINNTIFFDDAYLAAGNASNIDGDAMWGDARSGFPLGDPYVDFYFYQFFDYDPETEEAINGPQSVSFDFAWATSNPGADLDELEIYVEDYQGNSEYLYAPLDESFSHSLGGTGSGRAGHVEIVADTINDIAYIELTALSDLNPGGYVGEFAIDNLAVNGGTAGSEVMPVNFDGSPAGDYGTNCLKGTGIFSLGDDVRNGGADPTTFTVLWSPSDPALYQPSPQVNVPIGGGETVYGAVTWAIDTDTALSGDYSGTFTIVNDLDSSDPDDTVELLFFRLYDPPSLSDNSGSPVGVPGGVATLSNALASGHAGALRASVKVNAIQVTNPRFAASGIAVDDRLDAGGNLDTTFSFHAAGAPSGLNTGAFRLGLEMTSPDNYLNSRQPVADRVWQLAYTVAPKTSASPSVTTGQNLGGAGIDISGASGGVAVVDGSSAANQEVGLAFNGSPPVPNPAGVGEAFDLSFGTAVDLYVVELSYTEVPAGYAPQDLRVHAYDSGGGTWVPAITLNGNGGATVAGADPFEGSYADYLATLGGGTLDAADLGAFGVDPTAMTAWVVLDYDGTFQLATGTSSLPPRILGFAYDAGTNTATITYQSLLGESFGVEGGASPGLFSPLGSTAVGTGAVMEFQHQPAGPPVAFFYRLSRP